MVRKKIVNSSFIGDIDVLRERECTDFLEGRGFLVVPPIQNIGSITKIDELTSLFYRCMLHYNIGRKIHYAPSKVSDRKYMSQFLKSQKELGISMRESYYTCASIIKAMFEYEEYLNLDSPITSPTILTQKWLIDRVVCIINEEQSGAKEIFECEVDMIMDGAVSSEEFQENIGSNLNSIYEKVVNNGEKGKVGRSC